MIWLISPILGASEASEGRSSEARTSKARVNKARSCEARASQARANQAMARKGEQVGVSKGDQGQTRRLRVRGGRGQALSLSSDPGGATSKDYGIGWTLS